MDEEIIKKYKEAGRIANQALKLGEELIKPGKDMLDSITKNRRIHNKRRRIPSLPATNIIKQRSSTLLP
jgi:methionine aminopeptidase